MKNKFFITLFFLFNIFLLNNVYSQDFNFETNEIEIKDEGNIIEGKGGVIVTSNDNIVITSKESFYDKKKQELILKGNVVYKNTLKKISIQAEKITYDRYNEVITTYGNTIFEDKLENFFFRNKIN